MNEEHDIITFNKQSLIKLINDCYKAGFDRGGKTSYYLLKNTGGDFNNVKSRENFVNSKLLELEKNEK
jgi:hypothetical protein